MTKPKRRTASVKPRTGHCIRCGGEILEGELLHLETASCVHVLHRRLGSLEQAIHKCDREDCPNPGSRLCTRLERVGPGLWREVKS